MISTRISEVQSWKTQCLVTLLNASVPSIHIILYSYIVISQLICVDSSVSTGKGASVLLIIIILQSSPIMLHDV